MLGRERPCPRGPRGTDGEAPGAHGSGEATKRPAKGAMMAAEAVIMLQRTPKDRKRARVRGGGEFLAVLVPPVGKLLPLLGSGRTPERIGKPRPAVHQDRLSGDEDDG